MAWIKGNRYLSTSEMQNNAVIVRDYMIARGWTINAICGMLGNMQSESTINPGIWQNLTEGSGGGGGFGLVQWTPWINFTNWADENGYEWDDGNAQLRWINEVTATFGQWIPTSTYNFSFANFKVSTESPEYLASAFLKNFERAGVEVEETRRSNARAWFEFFGGYSSENQQIINSAVEWAVNIANDDRYGYDQINRWGPDYDCGTLVISAYQQAGCAVKDGGATYVANILTVFPNYGFTILNYDPNMELLPGDVFWKESHVAMYVGNGQVVEALANENSEAYGGEEGDQTGWEILVRDYDYTREWDYILRLPATGSGGSGGSRRKRQKFNFVLFNRRRRYAT